MSKISVPTGNASIELDLESGYLIAPQDQESPLPGGVPALDLFAQVKGSVTDAVEFILNLQTQGASV